MEKKADFIGFRFAGTHSSDLGIIRVSDNDRFEEKLVPEIKDITAEVPGMHGEYFFGSTYEKRQFEIHIAYDYLTEQQFRRLRQVYGQRIIGELIFDERPYKKYLAKIVNPIELSYVCFDEPIKEEDVERDGIQRDRENDETRIESFSDIITIPINTTINYKLIHKPIGNVEIEGIENYIEEDSIYTFVNDTEQEIEIIISYQYEVLIPAWKKVTPYKYLDRMQRIYKGEGTISFVCYFPFAKSVYKQLPFSYQKTNDEVIIQNKKYFTYNSSTLLYEIVEEPLGENLNDYYERVNKLETNDWAISSGILSVNEYDFIDKYDTNTGEINVYNAGDIPTGFRLYIPFEIEGVSQLDNEENKNETNIENIDNGVNNIVDEGLEDKIILSYKSTVASEPIYLILNKPQQKDDDIGFLIDTNNGLISGVSPQIITIVDIDTETIIEKEVGITYDSDGNVSYKTSGNLYNECVDSGHFFKLEPNYKTDNATIQIINGIEGIEIFYDYLYF